MSAGYRVHLANPAAMKKYEGLKYGGDEADAAYLAQLLRLGLLPEGCAMNVPCVISRASAPCSCTPAPHRFSPS